jgi:protein O-mannosyl-transferase
MFRTGIGNSFRESQEKTKKGRFPSWTIPIIIAVFAGILYLNSLGNEFTNWDDAMIYGNPSIRNLDWEGIMELFTPKRTNTYQPVRMLSYAIDYRFWKLNPLGYHITNTLFYILTCIMVFFALRLLSTHLRRDGLPDSHFRVGLFGALLFAAHPVHVEAVTWLAARKEVLQGFFFFLGFYLYLKAKEGERQRRMLLLGLVLISVLLAILSKPSAVVFPAVLLVYEISVRKSRWIDFLKSHWRFFLISILISLVFISILMKVMVDAGGVKAYRGGNFLNNFLLSFYVFIQNIKLLVFTINYSAAYALKDPGRLLWFVLLSSVGMTLLLSGLAIWSLKKTKVIFFAFFFFLVALLPYLNIIPISTLLADRYVFIASFSYCMLMGIAFDRLHAVRLPWFSEGFFKLVSVSVFLFLLAGYSFMTVHQNKIWENSYTLWSDAIEKSPESNTANALMGVVYMDLGMDEKAVEYLEKAVRILPYDYLSRNNLGIIYGKSGQPERALKEFMTALWLKPEDDTIMINLAIYYVRQKEYGQAEETLRYLLSKNHHNANLHFRLGVIFREAGKYDAAISEFQKSLELAPNIISIYEELGNIYSSRITDTQKAKFYYAKGIEMVPKTKSKAEELRWMIQDLECD